MTARYIPDRRTPVSSLEMLEALEAETSDLARAGHLILLAQWALETGKGASMHCFNVGNVKGRGDGTRGSWTYFTCDEILDVSQAAAAIRAARQRTDGIDGADAEVSGPVKAGKIRVLFHPSSPGACFRAFDTLAEGVHDYVTVLRRTFSTAWPALISGDAVSFSRALAAKTYYTAPEKDRDKKTGAPLSSYLTDRNVARWGYTSTLIDWIHRLDDETYVLAGLRKLGRGGDVASFQRAAGLLADGVAGADTRLAMAQALGDVNP